jgi:hypothetical protein
MRAIDFTSNPGGPNSKKRWRLPVSALLIASLIGLSLNFAHTFGANINLNTGGNVEFGQGMTVTTNCTLTDFLTVSPQSGYDNSASTTTFYFTSDSLTHIPASCWGKSFMIQGYDTSGHLMAIDGVKTSISVTYQGATSAGGGTVINATGDNTPGSYGGLTLTIPSPSAQATDLAKLEVQSQESTEWNLLYNIIDPSRNGVRIQYAPGFGVGVNDAASRFSGNATRIRYRMEFNISQSENYFADVSFDAPSSNSFSDIMNQINQSWTPTSRNLQIPAPGDSRGLATTYALQANVNNLSVQSNFPGVVNGSKFAGRVEIWPTDYTPGCSFPSDWNCGLYNGNNTGFKSDSAGFGNFVVSNISSSQQGLPQIVFAWDNWGQDVTNFGFGTHSSGSPDWTFDGSNGALLRYTPGASWNLKIFVR